MTNYIYLCNKSSRWFSEPSYMCNVVWDRTGQGGFPLSQLSILCSLDIAMFRLPPHTPWPSGHIQTAFRWYYLHLQDSCYANQHNNKYLSFYIRYWELPQINKYSNSRIGWGKKAKVMKDNRVKLWNCHWTHIYSSFSWY